MSASLSVAAPLFPAAPAVGLAVADARSAQRVAASLRRLFGVDFTIVDGNSAEVLHVAADQPCRDWAYRAELCREVARRGQPEFIEEDGPVLLLAIPRDEPEGASLVAIGVFLSRPLAGEAEEARAATMLGVEVERVRLWAARQTPIAAQTLERMCQLLLTKSAAEARVTRLESEVEKLSIQLGATYEEIRLIYRVIQNLQISRQQEELGQLTLEWLEAMPFDGMAMQLLPLGSDPKGLDAPEKSTLLVRGQCPVDNESFSRLIAELGLERMTRPIVLNRGVTGSPKWGFPGIRELIVVPIGGEGDRLFGWLAAFNHSLGEEFGTVEADLLSSVSAILGIHCGNCQLYREQAELLSGIIRALTSAIDAKDPYTCGHSDRVARVAVRLAEEMGCSREVIETIYLSGLLHDVGKIGIDDNVLRKPGKLTEAEFEHIKTHARIGYNILVDLKQLGPVLPVVLHHHEAWDGSGYPCGLKGEEIPELARIVAVADAFDAMGSDRPYRRGMPDEKLDQVIREGAGRQWDARVVEAFFQARDDIRAIARRESQGETELIPH